MLTNYGAIAVRNIGSRLCSGVGGHSNLSDDPTITIIEPCTNAATAIGENFFDETQIVEKFHRARAQASGARADVLCRLLVNDAAGNAAPDEIAGEHQARWPRSNYENIDDRSMSHGGILYFL